MTYLRCSMNFKAFFRKKYRYAIKDKYDYFQLLKELPENMQFFIFQIRIRIWFMESVMIPGNNLVGHGLEPFLHLLQHVLDVVG